MNGLCDVPGVDLRRWPTPQPIDIGHQIDVRLRSDHEDLIRAALWEQVEAGVTDEPMVMFRHWHNPDEQTVLVITFEFEPGCGRLSHRAGIWPPGAPGYQTVLELPTAAEIFTGGTEAGV